MIVPRTRLLIWFAAVVLPFATLAALEPVAFGVAVALISALGAIALIDALLSQSRLQGVAVELAELTRVSKDRDGSLELRLHNATRQARTVRIALGIPAALCATYEDMLVTLPGDAEWSRLAWPFVAAERGRFEITEARLEASSPLGFWNFWRTHKVRGEVRSYPNLLQERKSLAALFLNRGVLGVHTQRQVGQGRDFEKLREYVPGDSFDEIHWKATAKRGHPVTKVFQIERTQEVYVVVDASRLSGRVVSSFEFQVSGSVRNGGNEPETRNSKPETSTLERYITAALILGLAAEQQGDLFGLISFSDKVERFVRARNGKTHYHACRDALYALQPREVTPDFDEVASFIRLRLRRRALVIFLTALDDPVLAESFVRNMDLICRQHLVIVNMLDPGGAQPLFSEGAVESSDQIYDHLAGHLRWHRLREVETVLKRRGVRFSLLQNERLAAELVSQYVGVKQRQAL